MRLELNRRKFLKLTGVLALTASASALTACGGGDGNSPSNSNSTSPNPSTPSDTSDPDTPPETSSPEETNGILWIYRKTSETSATLLGYSTSGKIPSGDVVLPSVINGLEITKIHTSAFKSQTWTGVEIPATVQVIRESAFLGCSSLQRITLHEGLEIIQKTAFSQTDITSVTIPASVTSLESGIFNQCSKLSEITFLGNPSCSTALLSGIASLKKVTLQDSVWVLQSVSGLLATPKMFCSVCRMLVKPYSLPTATWGSWARASMS